MDFIKFVYNSKKSPPPSPRPFDYEVLENDLLLELILEKVETIDLKSCRLVSSKWNHLAVKQIRKNYFKTGKILRISSNSGIENFISTFGHDPGSILHNSLNFTLESCSSQFNPSLLKQFFTTFRHKFVNLNLGFSYNTTSELGNILRLQSNTLIELRICSRDPQNSHKLKFPTFLLPNLKHLHFCEEYDGVKHEEYAIGQLHLLESLLHKIPKGNAVNICLRDWERISETLELLKKFDQAKNLKQLGIFDIESGEFRQLADAGVCLEFLCLSPWPCYQEVMNDQLYTEETYAYLCHQSESIGMLAWANRDFKFPPTMGGLRKLILEYEDEEGITDADAPQAPILYEKKFPNLEELHIGSDSKYNQNLSSFESQFLSSQAPCISLKKLDIRHSQICAETFEKVSAIFSRITSLSFSHCRIFKNGAEGQRRLYSEIWGSNFAETLEELVIELELEDDEDSYFVKRRLYTFDHIFSDVPEVEISKTIASKCYTESYDSPKYHSVFKLKNLKTLKVFGAGTSGWGGESFTDFSAFCIFGKMKKLEYLHLDEGIQKFSKLALRKLRDKCLGTPTERQPEPHELDIIVGIRETDFNSNFKSTVNLLKHEPGLLESDDLDLDDEFLNDFGNCEPENTDPLEVVEKKGETFGGPNDEEFRKDGVQECDSNSESDMSDVQQYEDVSDSERSCPSIADVEFSEPELSDTQDSNELVTAVLGNAEGDNDL